MKPARRIGPAERIIAVLLGAIWACAGLGGIVLGLAQAHWQPVVLGLGALWYASAWLRVAARRRLLTWAELAVPWRRVPPG